MLASEPLRRYGNLNWAFACLFERTPCIDTFRTFLQWRLNHRQPDERFKVVADVIRHHRQEHACQVLEVACELAVECADIPYVLQRFISNGVPVPT